MSICDIEELATYEKVNRSAFLVLLHFFNNHLELLFAKFEGNLIEAVLNMLTNGLAATQYEV